MNIPIDEQIAYLSDFCDEVERGEYPIDSDCHVQFRAILATLQSIKDAGDDVVEPDYNSYVDSEQGDDAYNRDLRKYIDTLLSAYKRVCVEKDQALRVFKTATDEVIRQAQRAEKAEAERDELRKDAEQTKSDTITVIRKLLEALNHPNPPTSSQWEAIRVEARKQIAAIDSARNK